MPSPYSTMGVILFMHIEYFLNTIKRLCFETTLFRGNFTTHLKIQLSRTTHKRVQYGKIQNACVMWKYSSQYLMYNKHTHHNIPQLIQICTSLIVSLASLTNHTCCQPQPSIPTLLHSSVLKHLHYLLKSKCQQENVTYAIDLHWVHHKVKQHSVTPHAIINITSITITVCFNTSINQWKK